MNKPILMPSAAEQNQIEAALVHLPDYNPVRARRILAAIYETFVDMRPIEKPQELTKKQAQTLEVMIEFKSQHRRNATQQELADILGVDRKAVRQRIDSLKRKGYVVQGVGHRKIRPTKKAP